MSTLTELVVDGAAPAPDIAGPRFAFPVMARVAGLPGDALDLASEELPGLLDDAARQEAELTALAGRLEDALFRIVPRVEEPRLRRRILAGRRAVHRLADLPWDDDVRAEVRRLLDEDESRAVTEYRAGRDRMDRVTGLLTEQVAADRELALDVLHDAVRHPGMPEALVMAAPDWVRHKRPHERRLTAAKDVRTLVAYVSRAAAKTSPFSGLTTVGRAGRQGQGRALSRTTVELGYRALQVLARDARTAGLLTFRPAPVVRDRASSDGGDGPSGRHAAGQAGRSGLLLASELVAAGGAVWRDDRVVETLLDHSWFEALTGEAGADGPPLPLDTVLARVGGADPFARVVRLLDQGHLEVVPPWRRDEDPLAVLGRLLGDADSPVGGAVLTGLAEAGRRAAGTSGRERIEVAEEVDRSAAAVLGRAADGRRSGLVYEDRETAVAVEDPMTSPRVRRAMEALGRRARPRIFRSHVYDLMVEQFVAEFGAGGVCDRPLEFFMRLAVERDQDTRLQTAQMADVRARSEPGDRAWLPVGATSAPAHLGVMWQEAEEAPGGGRRAGSRVVVNNLGSGTGSIVARFADLLGADFRAELTAGVQALWGDVPARELTIWNDCNTAQAECSGVLPPLLLPKEPGASGGLTLDRTVLVHDAESDTLSLTDRGGTPFGLAYLGLTPKHAHHGYLRYLGTLADPWINGSPDCDYTGTKVFDLLPMCGPTTVRLPRIEDDDLVVRRESWLVPVADLPGADGGTDDVALLRQAHAFRRAHGIGDEVFVHQLGGYQHMVGGLMKPHWASLVSATSIRTVVRSLDPTTTHVRVVEALPGRRGHTQRDADGVRRATEHVVLMHWDRTGAGDTR
ncbi:MAG: hypothetical protein ACTHXO_07375 [Actinomycetaceae bacterium]